MTISVDSIAAWASVAYGCGFLVVLLHTGRLGLPVIELLEPIYVWIGLPFAALAFFGRRLLSWLKAHSTWHRDQLISALNDENEEHDPIADFVAEAGRAWLWFLPRRWASRRLRYMIDRLLHAVGRESRIAKGVLHTMRWQVRSLRAASSLQALTGVALIVGMTVFAIYHYVLRVYPSISQSYGGGAPLPVRLLLDSSMVSAVVNTDHHGTVLSREVELLFRVSDTYWIRSSRGLTGCTLDPAAMVPSAADTCILALDKAAIHGIVIAK